MNRQNKSFWLKAIAFLCALSLAGGAVYYWQHSAVSKSKYSDVYDFEYDRDAQALKNLFYQNWSWLIADNSFSTEFMLRKKAPNKREPFYFGKLIIKVLRPNDGDELAGFICYYKLRKDLGRIHFLAIDERFRKRGYGEQLVRYALDDLQRMGLPKVQLNTLTINYPAQRLYKRLGFQEEIRTSYGHVYFNYTF